MNKHEFCDHCPGCRPALTNMETGQVEPADSPLMIRVNHFWDRETTYAERKAFIEVTYHNSRAPEHLALASQVMRRLQAVVMAKLT